MNPGRETISSNSYLRRTAEKINRGLWSLESWRPRRVLSLGKRAARARKIGWYPGWYFGIGDGSRDDLVQLRKRIWKYFASREHEASFVMDWCEGMKIRVHLGNDLSWALFVEGCFEPNQFAYLRSALRPGMMFVDVGANDGLYSLYGSRCVGRKGRVLAVEPSEREYERLRRNLNLNRIKNVMTVRVAAWEDSGEAKLLIAERGHEGHNTLGSFVYNTGLLREEMVTTAPLDVLVAEQGIGRVDLMKIDAEGAESAALQGANGLIPARPSNPAAGGIRRATSEAGKQSSRACGNASQVGV